MKNQGVVKIFTVALALVCLFHLSFTIKSRMVDRAAENYANGNPELKQKYLDSIAGKEVYNLLLRKYTYMQVKERELNLGLDLQGGMNVTLEVSMPDVMNVLANYSKDPNFQKAITLANQKATKSEANYVDLFVQSLRETAPNVPLSTWFAHKDNKENINHNSTDEEVIAFLKSEAEGAVDNTYQILRSRIDRFGVSQPVIQKLANSGRIMVELPGISDAARARTLLVSSAKLEFWNTYMPQTAFDFFDRMDKTLKARLDSEKGIDSTDADTTKPINPLESGESDLTVSTDTGSTDTSESDLLEDLLGAGVTDTGNTDTTSKSYEEFREDRPLLAVLSNGTTSFLNLTQEGNFGEGCELLYCSPSDTATINVYLNDNELRDVIPGDVKFAWGNKADGNNLLPLYALKASRDGGPELEGDVITSARSMISPGGGFEVSMSMNTDGKNIWKRLTAENAAMNPKGHVAIVLDDLVYSAPRVLNEIPNGQTSIMGNFTQDDTKDLANMLNSGKMKAKAVIVNEAVVGPSLGKEAIQNGLISIIAGFLSVILIMAVIYSNAGWVANLAVLLNLFFLMGILSSLGAALTLPGIAGIILTMGMAVDANVLINEYIKENLEAGKNLRTSIANGYRSALSAILDSNITTLIAGIVLLRVGSGPVYGFAVTLIIGIISSLFTAILMTRLVFEWALKKDREIKFYQPFSKTLLRNANFDFIGKRKYFYSVSGLVMLVGLISIFTKGFDTGVDFDGGWSYVVRIDEKTDGTSIRKALEVPFNGAPEVKAFGSDNTWKITTSYLIDDPADDAADQVTAKLEEGLKTLGSTFEVESTAKVGATVADDIKRDAVIAIIIALILMFIYILIRFRKWQFAAGTSIKLAHDVIIVLGLFSLLDGVVPFTLEIDQSFIAAILTVIGYAINDSVVVMDRVREFLKEHKKGGIYSIMNDALNNTLSRTMITSLSTLGVLIILFIFGGEVIRGFSFAMLVGIAVGSYSSLCIGAPMAADLMRKEKQ